EIGLFDIEGVLVDSIVFDDQVADVSFGREPDGSDTWVTLSPTLGASNNGAYLGLVADTKFSPDRGFYEAPFEVEITCATPEATIYYTTDGSEPIDADGTPSPAAQVYSESNKPTITTTTCLRAAAAKDGWKSTDIDTQTYLFLDDVVAFSQQQAFNAGYPTIWYNSYPADYEMDQTPADLAAIAGDPGYTLAEARQVVKQSLLAIPTLSIATDKGNLFNRDYDPVTGGIYIYTGHLSTGGIGWERPVSAELFDPAGRFEPFQINCGLRLQGGESRRADKDPKHSFSLRFRGLYGEGKLRYRLFEDSPVDEFDSLQLRAMFNNSWTHWDAVQRDRTQMIRDQWMRDTLLAMGQIDAGRGIFVHLYLNGIYWGLYNVHERPLADHYAEYFGGVEEDYDAINGGAASDGDLTAWYEMKGIVAARDWDQIQQVLDVDNYIDWTVLNRYSHNLDLKSDGNWRAAGGGPGRAPWHLYSWDSEHVLEGPYNEGITPSPVVDPPGLWGSLAGIDEFMIRVHDRVRRHFFHGGALYVDPAHPQWDPDHPERNRPLARWARLAKELDQAIIAESARWGDYRRDVHPHSIGPYELYTRNDHWIPERDRLMNDYFPYRSGSVLDQLRNIGLYPTTDAPEFAVNGAPRHGGYVALGDSLSVTNPDGAGTIYYTLNGNDPRLPGGAVNTAGGATAYGGAVTISRSLPVKARVISGSQWSALSEAVFAIPVVAQKLRITELMYHPLDGGGFNDEDYEFIELQHIGDPGDDPINLNLVRFTNGIDYAFDDSVVLSPGDYVVLVKNQAAFAARYNTTGMNIAPGHYDGSLDNGGEEIDLADALGAKIHNFDYDDGWYEITDGLGFSLTSRNPRSPDPNDWDRKEGWRASYASDGSPGEDDSGFVLEDGAVLIHELLAHADTEPSDWIELYNATAGPIDIGGWFLSDDDQDLKKYEIEENYILPAGGYAVFKADPNFGPGSTDPGAVTPFALSENGEKVYLTSGSVGKLTGLYSTERSFGPSAPDVAFGHYVKSTGGNDFVAMSSNTPGWANAYPKIGPLVITEIAYHPASNGDAEYVELVNVSGAALTLYDAVKGEPWRFVDDGNDDSPGLVYRFPTETPLTLAAGEYLLLVKDEAAFTSVFGSAPPGVTVLAWGLANGSLSNGGEKPEIQMPGDLDDTERQWIRVDRVS
ncbi:MAG: lamin tail domain-containing protein, partial [Sedimentisphaerales bacterium]|nr:lamin tail domain-containing protein [Sedimentisphaerales bacterium]